MNDDELNDTDLEPLGVYLVNAASGMRIRIDFDKMTATRFADPDSRTGPNSLQRDDIETPLLDILKFGLGGPSERPAPSWPSNASAESDRKTRGRGALHAQRRRPSHA